MATSPTSAGTDPWRKRVKERTTRAIAVLGERRVGLSWNGIIIGGLGAGVALWPLATAARDLLNLTPGQAWRLAFLGACALLLAAGVVGANWKRTSPVKLVWLLLAAWLVAAGAVAALTALAWLVLGTPDWQRLEDLTPRHLDAITTRAFAIVAGLGGVALLVIAYRRQRTTEADAERAERAAEREVAKLFTETFDSASNKLGDEHPAVRLAGVHALARLADEAPEGREDLVQMVIDVLCAYLRMPYTYAPVTAVLPENASMSHREEHREQELKFASFREVRHTIIRIIGNRLRAPTRWRGKDYDFTGVVFDGGDLNRARFSGGEVNFDGAEFSGGEVNFGRAVFSGGEVNFGQAVFSGGEVNFGRAVFSGGRVNFLGAVFSGGEVNFGGAVFSAGEVNFDEAVFSGGKVTFPGARFSGGRVNFLGARFSAGTVTFLRAEFSGGDVFFGGAEFSGGTVTFQDASGECPINLLEAVAGDEPGVVVLPDRWQTNSVENGD